MELAAIAGACGMGPMRAALGLVDRIARESQDGGTYTAMIRRCDFVCRRESLGGALAFSELRPDQQREPSNSSAPARSDRDQPHHV